MVGTAEYKRKQKFFLGQKVARVYMCGPQEKMTAGFQKTDLLGVISLIEEIYE
jgi:hypothetical protein